MQKLTLQTNNKLFGTKGDYWEKKKIQTIAKQLAYSFEDIYLSPLEPKQRTPRTN